MKLSTNELLNFSFFLEGVQPADSGLASVEGGHGFIRIRLLNFTVRFEDSRPFPSTLCRDETRARGSGPKQKCNRNLYHIPRLRFRMILLE